MERGHRPVGEQAIAKLNLRPDARVLDVGCGSGWASRLMAKQASEGSVTGIDISDSMIEVARESSQSYANIVYQVASAESLPFGDNEFSDAFSMESLYYYADMSKALAEIHRVLKPGGLFVNVVDLYKENVPSHQWIEQLAVPVQLLSIEQYRTLFTEVGFVDFKDERLIDPTPVPDDYTGSSFETREDLLRYRAEGSLMMSGRAKK